MEVLRILLRSLAVRDFNENVSMARLVGLAETAEGLSAQLPPRRLPPFRRHVFIADAPYGPLRALAPRCTCGVDLRSRRQIWFDLEWISPAMGPRQAARFGRHAPALLSSQLSALWHQHPSPVYLACPSHGLTACGASKPVERVVLLPLPHGHHESTSSRATCSERKFENAVLYDVADQFEFSI